MTLTVDYFISFRSPYSYLSCDRVMALREDWDLDIAFRPVFPAAVRNPGLFTNKKLGPYIFKDAHRSAEMIGLPFVWPRPDPIVQDMTTMKIAAEQPYIERLTWLGAEATRRGRGIEFYRAASALIFGGTADWHEGNHLADAAARAGLDLADMDRVLASDNAANEALVRENEAALDATGHWGVPVLAVEGEPFFGQDRIDMAIWRLKQKGLKPRG